MTSTPRPHGHAGRGGHRCPRGPRDCQGEGQAPAGARAGAAGDGEGPAPLVHARLHRRHAHPATGGQAHLGAAPHAGRHQRGHQVAAAVGGQPHRLGGPLDGGPVDAPAVVLHLEDQLLRRELDGQPQPGPGPLAGRLPLGGVSSPWSTALLTRWTMSAQNAPQRSGSSRRSTASIATSTRPCRAAGPGPGRGWPAVAAGVRPARSAGRGCAPTTVSNGQVRRADRRTAD